MDKRKIGVIVPKADGVFYHRFAVPFAQLSEEFEFVLFDGFTNNENRPELYDTIVLNRAVPQPIDWLIHAKKQGVKIVVDIDDAIQLPKTHPNFDFINSKRDEEHIKETIKLADVVWVTNELLRLKLLYLNRNIEIVPNALNYSLAQWNEIKDPRYFLGWSGGVSHVQDLIEFSKVVPKGVNLCLAGDSQKAIWKAVHKAYNGVLTIAATDVDSYGVAYSYFEVAFAYLSEKAMQFNMLKSNLKMLEAGAYNLPFLASNIDPYKMLPKQGGYLCANKGEWHNAIKKLKDPNRRADMGNYLGEWTRKNYNLTKINEIRRWTL